MVIIRLIGALPKGGSSQCCGPKNDLRLAAKCNTATPMRENARAVSLLGPRPVGDQRRTCALICLRCLDAPAILRASRSLPSQRGSSANRKLVRLKHRHRRAAISAALKRPLLIRLGQRLCVKLFARLILVPDQKRYDNIDNREQNKPD